MTKAVVTSKGQITIPKDIRTLAHINVGSTLNFEVKEGSIIITQVRSGFSSLKGLLKNKDQKPVSIREMNAAIRNKTKGRK